MQTPEFQKTVDLFKQSMNREASAIMEVAESLPGEVVAEAVQKIHECRGKIIGIAVGKSGFIAQKFVATLNSIGIVSAFLHPAEALHGDVGMVRKEDLVVLISNGGESRELLDLLPVLIERGVFRLGIFGDKNSTAGTRCDLVLEAKVENEACPLNLVPSSSTSVAASICDALCICLSGLVELTPEKFALNHPSGALGKRLNLRLESLIYSLSEQICTTEDCPWQQAIQIIDAGQAGTLCILDKSQKLIGILTDGDVRRTIEKYPNDRLVKLTVGQIMTRNPIRMQPRDYAYNALSLMEDRESEISVIGITDAEDRYLGIVRLHDILKTGLRT